MEHNTYLKSIASFMLVLVLTLPVYSANAYASLQVTHNAGEDDIEGYLNAEGDRWQLEVIASHDDGSTITKNDVRVNGVPFDDCTTTSGLGTECSYVVNFLSNSRRPGVRPVNIELASSNGQIVEQVSTNVILDGSAPDVSASGMQLEDNTVEVIYSVDEKPTADCVGLEKIEFVHNNNVLKTIDGTDLDAIGDDTCDGTRYISNGAVESVPEQTETFTITAAQSGAEAIDVVATDRLGHEGKRTALIRFDASAPFVDSTTFLIGNLGRFVAGGTIETTLSINITDDLSTFHGQTLTAMMSSSDLGVTDVEAACAATGTADKGETVFTCTWEDVEVMLSGSIAVTITADDGHRTTTRTVTKQFTVDSSGPVLDDFGTNFSRHQVFVKARDNTFIAALTEAGSGINAEDVIADFSRLDAKYAGGRTPADTCTSVGAEWRCVWQGIDAGRLNDGGTAVVEIIEARDSVGNRGTLTGGSLTVERDDTKPEVRNVRAIVQGQQGIRNFFQSRDEIFITFEVVEAHDVRAFIDPSEIIAGSSLVEAECLVGEENTHICSITTPQIDQFGGREVRVPLHVYDGAGNLAKVGDDLPALSFAVFGTDGDVQNPDFWHLTTQSLAPEALDATISSLIPQRLFVTLGLSSQTSTIDILQSQVISCDGAEGHEEDGELITNAFMTNNFAESKRPVLVVEFEAFDATAGTPETEDDTDELHIECVIGLQSRRGNQVVQQIEEETVPIEVKFFLTTAGDDINRIEEEIDDAKDDAQRGLLKIIGDLNEILTWVRIICRIITIFYSFATLMSLVNAALDSTRITPAGYAAATGYCVTDGGVKAAAGTAFQPVQIICAVLSCSGQGPKGQYGGFRDRGPADSGSGVQPGDYSSAGTLFAQGGESDIVGAAIGPKGSTPATQHPALIAYFKWQESVLFAYNLYTGAGLIGGALDAALPGLGNMAQAQSLYANFPLSFAGLCLPGIIHNVEKYRQIQCRHVYCLENEVQAGIASIEACRELRDYQECKYWKGELFQLIPLWGVLNRLIELVKNLLKDPIAILRVVLLLSCSKAFCAKSGTLSGFCQFVAYFTFILDLVNEIVSTWQQIETQTEKDFCEQVGL
jgi:hypothetical protein